MLLNPLQTVLLLALFIGLTIPPGNAIGGPAKALTRKGGRS